MANLTDREILEACARACEQMYECLDSGVNITGPNGRCVTIPRWNPLEDDGDCARLETKCGIVVDCQRGLVRTACSGQINFFEPGNDAGRRRASCRVVARAQIEKEKGGA